MKKNKITLDFEESKTIYASILTSINYLENAKSRFILLDLNFYIRNIDSKIMYLDKLRIKLEKFLEKFEDEKYVKEDTYVDTFNKLLG